MGVVIVCFHARSLATTLERITPPLGLLTSRRGSGHPRTLDAHDQRFELGEQRRICGQDRTMPAHSVGEQDRRRLAQATVKRGAGKELRRSSGMPRGGVRIEFGEQGRGARQRTFATAYQIGGDEVLGHNAVVQPHRKFRAQRLELSDQRGLVLGELANVAPRQLQQKPGDTSFEGVGARTGRQIARVVVEDVR
ncbi:MAG: hypothetical protein AAF772_07480, partial [Acidobacteriota bacterium]